VGFPVLGKTFDVRFNLIPLGVVFLRRVHGIPDYVTMPKGWQFAAERRDFFPKFLDFPGLIVRFLTVSIRAATF
jgi:hypothetical protein